MISIITTRQISPERFCSYIDKEDLPQLYCLYNVFGRDIVYDAIDKALELEDIEEDDGCVYWIEQDWYDICRECCKISGKAVPKLKLEDLELTEAACSEFHIPIVEDKDADGNDIIFIEEDPAQMVFFPEMEKGLPPYKQRIIKKRVA